MKRVVIYSNKVIDQNADYYATLFKALAFWKADVFVCSQFFNNAKGLMPKDVQVITEEAIIANNPDVIISLGGDGTFLNSIQFIKDSGIPVMGINMGRLGFLANVAKEEIEIALDKYFSGQYKIDSRELLQAQSENHVFGTFNYALNEITLHKKDSASMISIHAYVDGAFLNSYWADGLIISTPTGSTAYSLSCGGPIMTPSSNNILITPIAPHNLNVRPVVLSNTSELKLIVEGRSSTHLISLDSRSHTLSTKAEVTIKKSDFKINIIQLEGSDFFSTMRNKLLWGLDKRN